ncbi:hypothetical protein BJ170DRAFT_686817 [Xylariales sp. AK1849]|nr:hypothetical protein BJ170DRAFT_686817 [Xylariales sp. AK1849]
MDQLKNAISGSSGSHSNTTQQTGGQQQDIGDKVFGAGIDKTGYGNKVSASNREKITDKIRDTFESKTGKDVPAKFSN